MAVQRLYATAQAQATSTGTGDVKTMAPPAISGDGNRHCVLSVETNDARVTFDGSTPSSSNGHILPKSALPLYLPLGIPNPIKFCSTLAGNSIVNVTWISD